MGLFNLFNNRENNTIIEVTDEHGEHILIEVPTSETKWVLSLLEQANVVHGRDNGRKRDLSRYQYRHQQIVDPYEDLEENGDNDDDRNNDIEYEHTEPYDESKVDRSFAWWR